METKFDKLIFLFFFFQESEIPIEQLLAQYSAAVTGPVMEPADNSRSTTSSSEEEILESQNLTLDKEAVARDLLNSGAPAEDRVISVNELIQNVSRSQAERLLRCEYSLVTLTARYLFSSERPPFYFFFLIGLLCQSVAFFYIGLTSFRHLFLCHET